MTSIPIDAASKYLLDGNGYTGNQLQRAIHCAHSVARAYEIADIDNGGDGSVEWSDIDDAQCEAADAMGPHAMREIVAQACEFNGFVPLESEVACADSTQDAAPVLTAAQNAEARAEGWSLFTHFGDTVELRLEHIDCPEAGEGELPHDAAAWLRVWTRSTLLHLRVIEILKTSSPVEHARIEAYVYGLETRHAEA